MRAARAHVLIAGVSTRAAAESAARAGLAVTSLDAFADLDAHPAVRALSLPRDFGAPFGAAAAARAARGIACDAVAYLSGFENHPAAVRRLAEGRALWGNAADVLRRARDPLLVAGALRRRGLAAPDARPAGEPPERGDRRPWVVKPLASGGGRRVRPWRRGAPVPRDCRLQELVEGTPASVVFVAAGGRAVPLGMSVQLVGEAAFGARGHRYCGSILAAAGDPCLARDDALLDGACALAQAAAAELGLVGVNGVDFIARDGVPWAIEVNPRWPASVELAERAYGLSAFGAHATACAEGLLPPFDLRRARRSGGAVGRAVVFARRTAIVGDTRPWLADATVRDVPRPGERVPAGAPVCTVFAAGADASECHARLVARAAQVHAALRAWAREAA